MTTQWFQYFSINKHFNTYWLVISIFFNLSWMYEVILNLFPFPQNGPPPISKFELLFLITWVFFSYIFFNLSWMHEVTKNVFPRTAPRPSASSSSSSHGCSASSSPPSSTSALTATLTSSGAPTSLWCTGAALRRCCLWRLRPTRPRRGSPMYSASNNGGSPIFAYESFARRVCEGGLQCIAPPLKGVSILSNV